MNRGSGKLFLVAGTAVVIIAVVATVLLFQEESLRGRIVRLEGNTLTLVGETGDTNTVKLDSVEGLTVGSEVEIDSYNPLTMSADKARVVRQ
jgi:hypothetical protein